MEHGAGAGRGEAAAPKTGGGGEGSGEPPRGSLGGRTKTDRRRPSEGKACFLPPRLCSNPPPRSPSGELRQASWHSREHRPRPARSIPPRQRGTGPAGAGLGGSHPRGPRTSQLRRGPGTRSSSFSREPCGNTGSGPAGPKERRCAFCQAPQQPACRSGAKGVT